MGPFSRRHIYYTIYRPHCRVGGRRFCFVLFFLNFFSLCRRRSNRRRCRPIPFGPFFILKKNRSMPTVTAPLKERERESSALLNDENDRPVAYRLRRCRSPWRDKTQKKRPSLKTGGRWLSDEGNWWKRSRRWASAFDPVWKLGTHSSSPGTRLFLIAQVGSVALNKTRRQPMKSDPVSRLRGSYRTLQCSTRLDRVLPSFTGFYWILRRFT